MSAPMGIGIYLRELTEATHGTPKAAAKKARDHGISFVALLACWQDERGHRPRNVRRLPLYAPSSR